MIKPVTKEQYKKFKISIEGIASVIDLDELVERLAKKFEGKEKGK